MMEETVLELASYLVNRAFSSEGKYYVSIVGVPGSGKTTLTCQLVDKINEIYGNLTHSDSTLSNEIRNHDIAGYIPMDGYHMYKKELDTQLDSKMLYLRRGAHWTFSPGKLLKELQYLKDNGNGYFPSFDHGIGDPIENDIYISDKHKIVIVEGNYLYLDEDKWNLIRELFDERWYLEVDLNVAMERVRLRHIDTGLTDEQALERCETNDKINSYDIINSKHYANRIIKSVDNKVLV